MVLPRLIGDMAQCVLLQISIFLAPMIASVVATTATPAFVEEPNDTVVMEGDTAVLMCSVANLREGYEVRWESDVVGTFTANTTVYGEFLGDRVEPSRYSIVGDSTVGEFNLQIKGADLTDADQYMCTIFASGRLSRTVSSSSKVKLTVDSTPIGYHPKCRPSTLKNYYLEGDTLEAKCIFRNTDQTLELQWYKSGLLLSGNRPYSSLADVTYEWRLSAADNGAKITCVANETSTCDVGPVEIYFKPRPAMESAIVEVVVGESAVFKVKGDWNPIPSQYSWSVNNVEVGNRLQPRFSHSGSILSILETQLQDDNASVSCIVTNSAGSACVRAKLRVRPAPIQTIYTSTKTTDTSAVSPLNDRPLSLIVIVVVATGDLIF